MAEEEKNNSSSDQEKDYLTDIIEESGDVVFASSNLLLKIEKRELHARAKWISVLILFVAMSGFLNGLDYASPDSGLIRPDEFVYALTSGAPENLSLIHI